jgi:HAMP domain-containing protein
MALPQLSIAQRLWLGLIMLLGLFAAAHLVSFDAARDVDKTLDELIRSGDERRGAGYEMRANLSIIVERVHAYLHDGDGRKRGLVREAQKSFEDFLNQYTETVLEQAGQDLAVKLRDGYAFLSRNIDEVFKLKAMASAEQASWPALQREVEALLAAGPAPMAAGRAGPSPATEASRKDLERALHERSDLLHPGPTRVTIESLARQQAQFGVLGAQNRKLAKRRVEVGWLDAAERWHIRAGNSLLAYVTAVEKQERSLKQLDGRHIALDALLANSVQPAARADLVAAIERASRIAHDANFAVTRSLILALLFGVAVALATVRAVRAPLRKVVASSRELAAGDFSKRVDWDRSDELGELAKAFNDMAERLQSTTVSRAYLELIRK